MTGVANVGRRLEQQRWVFGTMRCVTFNAGTDRSGAMEKITSGESLVAVGAEHICRNNETRICTLIMTVVATFISKGGMRGTLLNTLLLLVGF